jgi:hypothetical protein
MPYTTTGVPSRADDRPPSHTPPSSFSAHLHHLQRSTTRDAQWAYLAAALIRPDYLQLAQYLQQPFTIAHAAFFASSTPASSRTPLDRHYRTQRGSGAASGQRASRSRRRPAPARLDGARGFERRRSTSLLALSTPLRYGFHRWFAHGVFPHPERRRGLSYQYRRVSLSTYADPFLVLRLNLSFCIKIHMCMCIPSGLMHMSQLVCPYFQLARTSRF